MADLNHEIAHKEYQVQWVCIKSSSPVPIRLTYSICFDKSILDHFKTSKTDWRSLTCSNKTINMLLGKNSCLNNLLSSYLVNLWQNCKFLKFLLKLFITFKFLQLPNFIEEILINGVINFGALRDSVTVLTVMQVSMSHCSTSNYKVPNMSLNVQCLTAI